MAGRVIGSPRAQYDVTADGQRLLLLKDPERAAGDRARVVVVQNWVEELKQRVPTGR